MPIRIPEQLPAQNVLLGENIFTMDMDRAANQDIRPLEVGDRNRGTVTPPVIEHATANKRGFNSN